MTEVSDMYTAIRIGTSTVPLMTLRTHFLSHEGTSYRSADENRFGETSPRKVLFFHYLSTDRKLQLAVML